MIEDRWNVDGGCAPWPLNVALDGEATTIHKESFTGMALKELLAEVRDLRTRLAAVTTVEPGGPS